MRGCWKGNWWEYSWFPLRMKKRWPGLTVGSCLGNGFGLVSLSGCRGLVWVGVLGGSLKVSNFSGRRAEKRYMIRHEESVQHSPTLCVHIVVFISVFYITMWFTQSCRNGTITCCCHSRLNKLFADPLCHSFIIVVGRIEPRTSCRFLLYGYSRTNGLRMAVACHEYNASCFLRNNCTLWVGNN